MEKLCICSAMRWKILNYGKPVSNISVIRIYNSSLDSKWDISEEMVTDKNWEFVFPEVFGSYISTLIYKILPSEPYISQKIMIQYNSSEYIIWNWIKRNFRLCGETPDWSELYISYDMSNIDS